LKLPPPGIHTITGFREVIGHSEVQTFKNKQSSLAISVALGRAGVGLCGQIAPNALASCTPDQGLTGIGSRQRSSPTGGAAYGMPLNTAPPFSSIAPRISPPVTATV
jgi:hypothetical protein